MAASSTGTKVIMSTILCTVTTTGFAPTDGGAAKLRLTTYFAAAPSVETNDFARPVSATVRFGKSASAAARPGRCTVTFMSQESIALLGIENTTAHPYKEPSHSSGATITGAACCLPSPILISGAMVIAASPTAAPDG